MMMENRLLSILTVVLIFLTLFSCNEEPTHRKYDRYSMMPQPFYFKDRINWVKKVYLHKFEKNTSFNSLVSAELVEFKGPLYDSTANTTRVLITEVDYHYDFILEVYGESRIDSHCFSDVIIREFKAHPFNYFKLTQYVYNEKNYKGNSCNFFLESSSEVREVL